MINGTEHLFLVHSITTHQTRGNTLMKRERKEKGKAFTFGVQMGFFFNLVFLNCFLVEASKDLGQERERREKVRGQTGILLSKPIITMATYFSLFSFLFLPCFLRCPLSMGKISMHCHGSGLQ